MQRGGGGGGTKQNTHTKHPKPQKNKNNIRTVLKPERGERSRSKSRDSRREENLEQDYYQSYTGQRDPLNESSKHTKHSLSPPPPQAAQASRASGYFCGLCNPRQTVEEGAGQEACSSTSAGVSLAGSLLLHRCRYLPQHPILVAILHPQTSSFFVHKEQFLDLSGTSVTLKTQ